MPDVARDTGDEDVGVAAFERASHRQLRNGMTLPEIFAQEKSVDPRGVAAHDHVLIIVRKNLRLDKITRAQQLRQRARLAHAAKRATPKLFVVLDVGALQLFAGKGREIFALAKIKMPSDIDPLETRERTHSNVIKLRQQK